MVTKRMKEAGVKELFFYERGSDMADDVVVAIYEAMVAARLQEQSEVLPTRSRINFDVLSNGAQHIAGDWHALRKNGAWKCLLVCILSGASGVMNEPLSFDARPDCMDHHVADGTSRRSVISSPIFCHFIQQDITEIVVLNQVDVATCSCSTACSCRNRLCAPSRMSVCITMQITSRSGIRDPTTRRLFSRWLLRSKPGYQPGGRASQPSIPRLSRLHCPQLIDRLCNADPNSLAVQFVLLPGPHPRATRLRWRQCRHSA